jgi:hypothetical protein
MKVTKSVAVGRYPWGVAVKGSVATIPKS